MSAITWLLIGPLFLGRQSGDRLALDIDYNSKVSIPGLSGFSGEEMGEKVGK